MRRLVVDRLLGSRKPPGRPAAQPFRRAFVYVAIGCPADPAASQKLERIRTAWPGLFAKSAEGRGSVDPRLN